MSERFECTTLAKKRYINTLPFLSFPFLNVERGHCARLRLYWYNDQCQPISLTRAHLLLASKDVVPVSMWHDPVWVWGCR